MEKLLYRYDGFHYGTGGDEDGYGMTTVYRIECYDYVVVKETPKGFWINEYGRRRWVPKKEGARWAHETKEQALTSFIARKKRAIQFARSRLKTQEMYLAYAEALMSPAEGKPEIEIKCPVIPDLPWSKP